jgi:hypothetical protein
LDGIADLEARLATREAEAERWKKSTEECYTFQAAQSRTIERMRKVLQQVSDWCPENGPIGYVGFIARKALAGEEG